MATARRGRRARRRAILAAGSGRRIGQPGDAAGDRRPGLCSAVLYLPRTEELSGSDGVSPNRIPGGASGGPLDLAERLRLAGASLRAKLRRREALEEIVREAYADMDPGRIARMLVGSAAAWIPLDAWALLAADGTGQLTLLHAQGRVDARRHGALGRGDAGDDGGPRAALGQSRRRRARADVGAGRRRGVRARRPRAAPDGAGGARSPPEREGAEAGGGAAAAAAVAAGRHGPRARPCGAAAAGRGAVGDRRPHGAAQLALPARRAAPRGEARGPLRAAPVGAVRRSRRVQARERHARPPVRQPDAGGGWPRSSAPARGRATSWRGTAATSSCSCCPTRRARARSWSRGACATGWRRSRSCRRLHLDVRLTASVGIASLPDVTLVPEDLLRAADEAMYRVKERGKNDFILATRA